MNCVKGCNSQAKWTYRLGTQFGHSTEQKKGGSLRLCLDRKSLNVCIRREHFQIPTIEDISAELNGKKLFSILDQKDSYWQIRLDHGSSLLCTFNTHTGRYHFLKMPFGISSAAEVQQKKTCQVFGAADGWHWLHETTPTVMAGTDYRRQPQP